MKMNKRVCLTVSITAVLSAVLLISVSYMIQLMSVKRVAVDGIYPDYDLNDLIELSSIISEGEIIGSSKPFIVEPQGGGDASVFVDYYFKVSNVLGGDIKPGDIIPVRTEGGKCGKISVENYGDVGLKTSKKAVAFFRKHKMTGKYITSGVNEMYYYTISGGDAQGIYWIEDENDSVYKSFKDCEDGFNICEKRNEIMSLYKKVQTEGPTLYEAKVDRLYNAYAEGEITESEYNARVAEID